MSKLVGIAVGLVVLSIVFGLLERLFATLDRPKRDRRTLRTDVTYWFFTPLVTRTITRTSLFLAAVLVALVVGKEVVQDRAVNGWGPIILLPTWAQALTVLVVGDFVHYWIHRAFHGQRLWKFHAIHHSPKILDWLSASRVHPINDVVNRALTAVPLFLLGVPFDILAVYVPFLGFFALLLHANVPWDFGPLRGVIASPRFHRWHHTSEEEGLDKNFAGMFPVWDRIFGTYYMPEGREPVAFGVPDAVPDGVWDQLKYPFRQSER